MATQARSVNSTELNEIIMSLGEETFHEIGSELPANAEELTYVTLKPAETRRKSMKFIQTIQSTFPNLKVLNLFEFTNPLTQLNLKALPAFPPQTLINFMEISIRPGFSYGLRKVLNQGNLVFVSGGTDLTQLFISTD